MKNVKFRGKDEFRGKKTNSALNSAEKKTKIPRLSAGAEKLWALIIMIKYTTFINTQITSSNKKPQMHPTGISLYFTFDIFHTISFIHSFRPFLERLFKSTSTQKQFKHAHMKGNRINQKR